jgi:hypothetical protein
VSSDLTWKKQVIEQCLKGNKLLGFPRRSSREIRNPVTRRCLYISHAVVRSHLGYATQIWAPQTIELIKRVERVQRRATKFILNLPFYSEVPYEERLIASNLLPISFWHEYLDFVHFFKMIDGLVYANKDILPARNFGNERKTRATSNPNLILFRTKKCKTVTYQISFINRTTRIWNILPNELKQQSPSLSTFKYLLYRYYTNTAININYESENSRTWKSISLKCDAARSLATPLFCCSG